MYLPDFSKARVLVGGDVMLDRYWSGQTSRISPEAPVPVVKLQSFVEQAGGAANVAKNLSTLGVDTLLVGVVGRDSNAAKLKRLVEQAKIKALWVEHAECATIAKLRVLSQHQQLIRLDFEDASLHLGAEALAQICEKNLAQQDVLILSDYAKGSLHSVSSIIQGARSQGKIVLVDPKGCDFERYRGASLLTPNMSEFQAVVGECLDDSRLEEKGEALRRALSLQALLITRSEKGMVLLQDGRKPYYLPAKTRDVYDVTGAGDTVIAVLGASIAAGENFENSAMLANLAAGIAVTKLGAQSVSVDELTQTLAHSYTPRHGVLDEKSLRQQVADAKAQGERIVMTNGCFDLLHAGHVGYLEKAAQLGDRLIVAINSDASVKQLKGKHRPINPAEQRAQVIAALGCVDWVVIFNEDTPQRLINCVLPTVLVKGGDYKVEDIAGAQVVMQNGGEVKILPYQHGCSTSEIIARIREID